MKNIKNQIEKLIRKSEAKGNAKSSILALIEYSYSRTGFSGYSKGWATKRIWTADTLIACRNAGIIVESGNNAPRGGAIGEYVRLIADKRKNRVIHKYQKYVKIELAEAKRIRDELQCKENTLLQNEYDILLPYAENRSAEIKATYVLSGIEKSNAQCEVMKSILADASIERSCNFWVMWRFLKKSIA